ncbi:PaaI family thioesterase [Sulfitobacter sp. EhC04]|uniref:PaaI family thioesterase n=1 Tax=Sulfitobacter sp. EhC04 TaxID=1849168 RepID=UPI001F385792|nr:PaaI family thioesterase [Sulfitobacter sp. EhC04]
MTGFEMVKGLSANVVPRPPMKQIMPFEMLMPERIGEVELVATPEPRFANLLNMVNGGWGMTLLDTVMGLAAQSTLNVGEMAPTHETSVKFIRPIPLDIGPLRIIGKVVSQGKTLITLEGRIENYEGKLFAHGTSTCVAVSAL